MTHEIAEFEPAHDRPKAQYLRGVGCRQKDAKKRPFKPFDTRLDTQFDTRRHVSGQMPLLPTMDKLAGANWQTKTITEKRRKIPAVSIFAKSFRFLPHLTYYQESNIAVPSTAAFLPGTAYSLTTPFFTLQNAAL